MNKSPYKISKVYSYGCLPPINKSDLYLINNQLRMANNYYNTLIEIEKEARDIFNRELNQLIPDLAQIENKVLSLIEQKNNALKLLKQSRSGTRKTDKILEQEYKNISAKLKQELQNKKQLIAKHASAKKQLQKKRTNLEKKLTK